MRKEIRDELSFVNFCLHHHVAHAISTHWDTWTSGQESKITLCLVGEKKGGEKEKYGFQ
jgi:hypothetical protein